VKIVFFLPSFPEISETFILRQVTGLIDRGHDVRILAQARGDTALMHPAMTSHSLLHRTRFLEDRGQGEWRAPLDATVTAAKAAREMLPNRSLRKAAAAMQRVATVRTEPPCDIVHCHYGDTGMLWGFAARLWNAPLVVSFYGYDCTVVPRRYGEQVYHPLFRNTSLVTALSNDMQQRLIGLGCPPDRITVQPLGVDLGAFAFQNRAGNRADQPLRVLSVARLTEKKGLADALRALAAAREQLPLTYEVIGDGPLRETLEQLAVDLGLAGVVRFRGALPQPDVVSAMHRADLFLLPSVVAADGDEEGTPTVLIEAAATGLPVISTSHAGIPEVVVHEETGLLVPERSLQHLADALLRLAREPGLRSAMGKAGRERAEKQFDTRMLSGRLEDLYRTLVPRSA
jgi:colanic acid/amylovoran biosynthesis glycosyltransferase